jgi:hypothetical protein
MKFGTWYQINCEGPETWADDFAAIRNTGFDFVVLWNVRVPARGVVDLKPVVENRDLTERALDAAGKAGLRASLGVWNPSCMGAIPKPLRVRCSDGGELVRPNIFEARYVEGPWADYIRALAGYKNHPAFGGAYFDDSFSVRRMPGFWSYAKADIVRYREFLKRRYVEGGNLAVRYRPKKTPRSFDAVKPPLSPQDDFAAWTDWMDARAQWAENFARRTVEIYRSIDSDPRHELVLSEMDYYFQRSQLHWGVDYRRLMRHFDRFEIYQADDFRNVRPAATLANARRNITDCQATVAGTGKPFQYHTWWTDPATFSPMPMGLLSDLLTQAKEMGASTAEIYTFKVHDWRAAPELADKRGDVGRPPFREVSMKYHPRVRAAIARMIGALA